MILASFNFQPVLEATTARISKHEETQRTESSAWQALASIYGKSSVKTKGITGAIAYLQSTGCCRFQPSHVALSTGIGESQCGCSPRPYHLPWISSLSLGMTHPRLGTVPWDSPWPWTVHEPSFQQCMWQPMNLAYMK